jgi:hypothetical protein
MDELERFGEFILGLTIISILAFIFITPIVVIINVTLNWLKDSFTIPAFCISRQHSVVLDWYTNALVSYSRTQEVSQTPTPNQGDFWQYWWVWFLISG